jgi:hypothetical protein
MMGATAVKKVPVLPIFGVLCLAGCGDSSISYQDATDSGRGLAELQMDGAACDQEADYAYQNQIAAGPNSNANLAIANVGTAMIVRSNAFEECMNMRGWQRNQ